MGGNMIDLVLATASEEWEARVGKAFEGKLDGAAQRRDVSGLAGDPAAALSLLLDGDPRVVVLGPDVTTEPALRLAGAIDAERPDVCVVLVADPTPEMWQGALRAGVRDIVPPDAPLTEVRATIERALETASRRRATVALDRSGLPKTRVITVVSPKGGAGKTAISTNLAVGLARHCRNEVVLVDLDLQFGDVANALRLAPETTIADVSRSLPAIDATMLKAYLTPHPAGLFALCAPHSPAAADDVETDHIGKVIDMLAGVFRHVVIDTAAGLDEVTLAAMEHATDLVVVCATDVASARGVRKELEAFDVLGFASQQRHFVLNRADAKVGLSVPDIEATVGMPVNVSIPSSRAVPMSMNQGTPLVDTDDRSPFSRSLQALIDRFHEAPQTSAAPTSVGALWRRRKETR